MTAVPGRLRSAGGPAIVIREEALALGVAGGRPPVSKQDETREFMDHLEEGRGA